MKTPSLPKPLRGIVPPMITPLLDYDRLDHAGLEKLIEHILGGGASALFLLGTTGEGSCLGYSLRKELLERACRQIDHRVPVLAGITDTAFPESLGMAAWAADCGADAVVVAPPFAFPGDQADLREYLRHLSAKSPLPLFLYNVPPLTKATFDLETVRWAIQQPRILGLKDSSGDLTYFRRVCALLPERPEWTLLMGPEELLAESIGLGGHGGVCGGANVFPRLYVDTYTAALAGDQSRLADLQAKILRVARTLYSLDTHPSAVMKGLKCALSRLGICSDVMAEPFHQFSPAQKGRIRDAMDDLCMFVA